MEESIPITGLEKLEKHLQELVGVPETPLDAKLFDEVELQLTGESDHSCHPLSIWVQNLKFCCCVEVGKDCQHRIKGNDLPVS